MNEQLSQSPLAGQGGGAAGPRHMPGCSECGAEVAARCVYCGRLLCRGCRLIDGEGKTACPGCAREDPAQRIVLPPRAALREPRWTGAFPAATWDVGEALVMLFLAFALGALVIGVSTFISEGSPFVIVSFLFFIVASVGGQLLFLALPVFSARYRHGAPISAIGLSRKGTGGSTGAGILFGVPLAAVAIGSAFLSVLVFDSGSEPINRGVEQLATDNGLFAWAFLVFSIVVIAPVCEEVFFRGYLYPAMRNSLPAPWAIVLNGTLFSAVHLGLVGFLPRATLGCGLCYLYEKRKNVAGPVVAHALYNGALLLLSAFVG